MGQIFRGKRSEVYHLVTIFQQPYKIIFLGQYNLSNALISPNSIFKKFPVPTENLSSMF